LKKLVVIDGNSILNRAFYGILSNKMLQTADGIYTNAVYGFLSVMFKLLEDVNPEYMVVAFDVKHPTKRHEMYKEYKATRKGMPDELASQMPIIKEVLSAMNITVIEKEGYEADDILGTLAKHAEKKGCEVTLLTGDRDSFQLASDKITIRIPRTKAGKSEVEDFDRNKILEVYGIEPKQLIEVKGLMGDNSDNIPGIPGVGEKTALELIKRYISIDNLYRCFERGEDVARGKLKERLKEHKDLAILSRELGRIDVKAPIDKNLENFKLKEWNREEVLEIFKRLRFNRYIERFNLDTIPVEDTPENTNKELFEYKEISGEKVDKVLKDIQKSKNLYYYFEKEEKNDHSLIIKKTIKYINIYNEKENVVYNFEFSKEKLASIFENENVLKCGHKIKEDYILLKQIGIQPKNMMFDAEIAMYILNSTLNSYSLEELAKQYLDIDILRYIKAPEEEVQTSLFDNQEMNNTNDKKESYKFAIYAYVLGKTKDILLEEMKKIDSLDLFNNIEMPVAEVLAEMQYTGIYIDEKEIIKFGNTLKDRLEELTIDIYNLAGEEFNINSSKQLGVILFEKLKLEPSKKNKSGFSTDVEALEKIRASHPIIDKILDYRQVMKLNSTFVEGMIPFINLIWNNLKSKKQRKALILTLIVLTILPTVLNSFDWYTKDFFLKPWSSNTYQKLIPDMWSVIYPLTYYFIGAYLGEYKIKLGTKKNFVLLVVSVFIFGLYNYFRNYGRGFLMNVTNNYNSVDNLITSVLFFVLILNLKIDKMPTIVNKSISSIARLSLSTYLLSNILDLFVYPKLIEMTDSFSERLIYYFPVVLFVFVLSNVFSYCVDYIAKLVVCFIDFLKSKLCRPEMNPKEN